MIEIIGFIFISIFGILAHFFYKWSNYNKIVGLFFPVNESVWEHVKLIIAPTLLWILIEAPLIGDNYNFLFASSIGLLVSILLIPTFFYMYTWITNKNMAFLNISSFFISVFLGRYFTYTIMNNKILLSIFNYIGLMIIALIVYIYLTLTLKPLKSNLFKDPINNKYGFIRNKKEDKSS